LLFHISPIENRDSIMIHGILSPLDAVKLNGVALGIGSRNSRRDVVQLFSSFNPGVICNVVSSFISDRGCFLRDTSYSAKNCDLLAFILDRRLENSDCFVPNDEVELYCKDFERRCDRLRFWPCAEVWLKKRVNPDDILDIVELVQLPGIAQKEYESFWSGKPTKYSAIQEV